MFIVELAYPEINQNWGMIRFCGYCKAGISFVKYIP
jgi:hypothetical protein